MSENLWQAQFDREFTVDNLWEVQSDIALRGARELATELSPEDLSALDVQPPTENLAALAAYGRAREIFYAPVVGETSADAVAFARRAVELDPEFVEAAYQEQANREAEADRPWLP